MLIVVKHNVVIVSVMAPLLGNNMNLKFNTYLLSVQRLLISLVKHNRSDLDMLAFSYEIFGLNLQKVKHFSPILAFVGATTTKKQT